MPNIQITIDTTVGQAKIARVLQAVQPRTLLDRIGAEFLSYVDQSFKTRGRGTWKPLAWTTLALRKHGGDAPLQDTGRYKESWVKESDSHTYVEVGTNIKTASGLSLAAIHEYGTKPYTIRVKRAKVLAAEIGGGIGGAGEHGPIGLIATKSMVRWLFFGKEVHHPGVPARPVLPTKAVAERLTQAVVDKMLARLTEGGAR